VDRLYYNHVLDKPLPSEQDISGKWMACSAFIRKGIIMSNQSENEKQQSRTPQDARQFLLTELEARHQTIAELSNEQLEAIVGGVGISSFIRNFWLKCFTCGGHGSSPYTSPSESPRSSFSGSSSSSFSGSVGSVSGSDASVGSGRTIHNIPSSPTSVLPHHY
jgi:hypothetical protein